MIHGIINVLKPTGMSSHDVIGCLRRIYGMKKMGHAGTFGGRCPAGLCRSGDAPHRIR
jgi:hypothetical protein